MITSAEKKKRWWNEFYIVKKLWLASLGPWNCEMFSPVFVPRRKGGLPVVNLTSCLLCCVARARLIASWACYYSLPSSSGFHSLLLQSTTVCLKALKEIDILLLLHINVTCFTTTTTFPWCGWNWTGSLLLFLIHGIKGSVSGSTTALCGSEQGHPNKQFYSIIYIFSQSKCYVAPNRLWAAIKWEMLVGATFRSSRLASHWKFSFCYPPTMSHTSMDLILFKGKTKLRKHDNCFLSVWTMAMLIWMVFRHV